MRERERADRIEKTISEANERGREIEKRAHRHKCYITKLFIMM